MTYDISLQVPNSKVAYRHSTEHGWEMTPDGEQWYFTWRALMDILELHPTIEYTPTDDADERELFGETLDEEIPDDLWAMVGTHS